MTNFSAKTNAAYEHRLALDSEEGGRFARAQADLKELIESGAVRPAQEAAFAKRRESIYDLNKSIAFNLEKSVHDPRYAWGFINEAFESSLKKAQKDPFYSELALLCREDALARLAIVGWSKMEAPEWSVALDSAALKWSEGLKPERALRAMSMGPPERFKAFMLARPPESENRRAAALEAARWTRMETASLALGSGVSLLERVDPMDPNSPSFLSLAFKKGLGAQAALERIKEEGAIKAIALFSESGYRSSNQTGMTWRKEQREAFGKSALSVDPETASLGAESFIELIKIALVALGPHDFKKVLKRASIEAGKRGQSIKLGWEDAALALMSIPRGEERSEAIMSIGVAGPYIESEPMVVALGLLARAVAMGDQVKENELAIAESLVLLAYKKSPASLWLDSGMESRGGALNANALEMASALLIPPSARPYSLATRHASEAIAEEFKPAQTVHSIVDLCLKAGLNTNFIAPSRKESLEQKLAKDPWSRSGIGERLSRWELEAEIAKAPNEAGLRRTGPKTL